MSCLRKENEWVQSGQWIPSLISLYWSLFISWALQLNLVTKSLFAFQMCDSCKDTEYKPSLSYCVLITPSTQWLLWAGERILSIHQRFSSTADYQPGMSSLNLTLCLWRWSQILWVQPSSSSDANHKHRWALFSDHPVVNWGCHYLWGFS